MTRGRCGSLLLHHKGLTPSTPCRSPGALRFNPESGHGSHQTRRGFSRSKESLSRPVSVSGKRDFAEQRQRPRKGPSHSTDRQQRQSPRAKSHQFGAICTTPRNLCLYGTAWWGWEDSNFQPNDYQPLALSIEQRPLRPKADSMQHDPDVSFAPKAAILTSVA
jgi:hypothetical protein